MVSRHPCTAHSEMRLAPCTSGSDASVPLAHRFPRWAPDLESPDESRSRRRRGEERMDRLRHGRPRATDERRAERPHTAGERVHLLRALDFVSDRRGLPGSRWSIPACLRRAVRRSLDLLAAGTLDLDRNDQVYGVEVSNTMGPSLLQVMVSPGKAEAILHDRSHRGVSTAGRWQFDLAPRATIVGSAFYRHSTDADPRSGTVGAAFGFAPTSRVSIWTEADATPAVQGSGRELVGGGQ